MLRESRIRDLTTIAHGNYLAQARYTLTYNEALRIVDRLSAEEEVVKDAEDDSLGGGGAFGAVGL